MFGTKKLKDLPVEILDGDRSSRYPKRHEMVADGVLFLSTPALVDGQIDFSNTNFITQEKFDEIKKGRLVENDIVMTTRGTIGKVAYFKPTKKYPTGLINAQMLILRADPDKINPRFLFYVIGSEPYQDEMRNFTSGSAQPQIPISDLKETELTIPSLKEQNKIVDIIDAYSNLIENNSRRITILENMAQNLYREWFVNFRFPGHEQIQWQVTPQGKIPAGWEIKRLDDFVVLQRGFDLPKSKRNEDGNIPVYAASGINGFHDEAKAKAPGLVTGRSGTLGIVNLVLEDYWPLNTALWVKEFKGCSAYYAYYLLSSIGLERFNSGASVPTLNRNDIHGLEVIAPPADLIEEFESHAKTIHGFIRNLISKNKNLKQQRDMLLPKLISG